MIKLYDYPSQYLLILLREHDGYILSGGKFFWGDIPRRVSKYLRKYHSSPCEGMASKSIGSNKIQGIIQATIRHRLCLFK